MHVTGRLLAWVAVAGASFTSRTSETIEPDALVPPPKQGFGIPDVELFRAAGLLVSAFSSVINIDGVDIERDNEHNMSVLKITKIF